MEFMDPYEFMRRFRRSMRDIFEELLKGDVGILEANFRIPKAKVVETKGKYVYEVELPGVDKKDIVVEVNDEALMVRAERHIKVKRSGKMREESLSFKAALPTFPDADYGKAKAKYKDGILHIEVPKVKKGRKLKIS